MTVVARDHETVEEQLRELMVADEKTRTKHDKLLAEISATEKELTSIALRKMELTTQLAALYKKHANGTGKRGKEQTL